MRTPVKKPTGLFLLSATHFDEVYGAELRARIASRVEVPTTVVTPEQYHGSDEKWPEVEMIFSGWGIPKADANFLRRFPNLRIIFYSAGSIKVFATDAFWESGIRVTHAAAANAVPVVEFTCAQIIHALKGTWQTERYIRREKRYPPRILPLGAFQRTVGLLSLGMIGWGVVEKLQSYDLRIIAFDPFVSKEEAKQKNVSLLSLDEVFAQSNVVSCHTPWLPETERLIRGHHFDSMKPQATFINTARGAVVAEDEMIGVLQRRHDLFAFLDVTHPEPPAHGSPLYELANVVLTPHMAGSMGGECHRMTHLIIEELDNYLAGKPLRHELDQSRLTILA